MRMIRQAHDLPVPHHVAVDIAPPVLRRDLHESALGGLRILRVDQPHEVGYPVHMGIDAYGRDPHGVRADAGGGLPPDHRERYQLLGAARDLAPVFVAEDPAASDYSVGLLPGESRGTDEPGDDLRIRIRDCIDRIVGMEQIVGSLPRVVVPGALRQDRGYQHMERIRGPLGVQSLRVASRIRSAHVLF